MVRYYEVNVDPAFKAETDFVFRNRSNSLWKTAILYVVGTLFVVLAAIFRKHIGGEIPFMLLMTVVIGLLTLHCIITVQRHLDLVLSIEFQNALFSSAFKEGNIFSMIVSQDDQLFYADPGFYELFPELSKQNSQILDAIVKQSEDPQQNLEILNNALISKQREAVNVFVSMGNEQMKARMSIVPLNRPKGYFFVSARLFHENRAVKDAAHVQAPEKSAQPEHNMDALLDVLNEHIADPAYILDAQGELVTMTHPFIAALGYENSKELQHLPVTDILFNYAERDATIVASQRFEEHKVNFRKKSGSLKQAHITQQDIEGLSDYVLGTVSFIE